MTRPTCFAHLLLLLPAILPLAAQQPITLDVVVTPTGGRDRAPVAGLARTDLVLLDNGRPQPITGFRAGPAAQAPAELLLLLDSVNVPFTVVANERQQIASFLRSSSGALTLPTTLGLVSDAGIQVVGGDASPTFTRDGNVLAAALDHEDIGLRTIRRSEGIYGAEDRLSLSINALRTLALHERARPGRKVVIWVSPGWPALSGPGIELSSRQQDRIFAQIMELSTLMRQANITLYCVDPIGAGESVGRANYFENFVKGIEKPSQTDLGDLSLQVLAIQSGGLYLHGNNDIAAQLRQAVADTTAFYELSFNPPPAEHPGQYHHLEVRVEKPGLAARTRTGYYNPAPPPDSPK